MIFLGVGYVIFVWLFDYIFTKTIFPNSFFSQLSIGLNIIVSMATTLTAGYWIGKMYVAPGKPIIGIPFVHFPPSQNNGF